MANLGVMETQARVCEQQASVTSPEAIELTSQAFHQYIIDTCIHIVDEEISTDIGMKSPSYR